MDETKRSRCCSLRSACTRKISDIKLSDNGNCCACLVLLLVMVCSLSSVDKLAYLHLLLSGYSAVFAHL